MANNLAQEINQALSALAGETPLREGAKNLLHALGYESARTVEVGAVEDFLAQFVPERPLSDRQRGLFEDWTDVEMVFQVTGNEIEPPQGSPSLAAGRKFDGGRVKSFLFLAAQLRESAYPRAHLAETVRAVNCLFKMPVIVLFRHGGSLTLAAIHRRAHMRDDNRDVLERVTLVKDIRLENPHRAHIEILADLALERMKREGVRSFDDLHLKWEQKLDIEALNKRFYKKLFEWFERAVHQCRFPDDNAGDGFIQRHVIRLITRLLFIWFLKEKGLVPQKLFDEQFARECLKEYKPESTDYYRAVIQNLFFATLNTEIDRRGFNGRSNAKSRDFSKYRYRSLLRTPDKFVKLLKQVPFVNGGLFDCLDDFSSAGTGGSPIDAFTDNIDTEGRGLHVPAELLLNQESGLFALLRQHKFTVEENTPLDTEVALDPELLGRVFENLLAAYNPETRESARKATGSYYTPRPVVDYMVREALSEALASNSSPGDGDADFWRERIDYLLDHSAAMDDASDLFSESEKRAIVTAIAELRTLDPAVGSGAFPMGILQTLTLALRRLDAKNALWESFQKERAASRAGQAFDTADRRQRDRELEEISATFERYRKTDFGRKLYLIQNGIYGVDIQPIACQIAKLRFFISLVIEQTPDATLQNLGIKPLPNLETQLVAADTLLDLKTDTADLLHEDAVALKQREVASVRERYFLAGSRPRKLECMREDKHLRNELRELLEQKRRDWIAAQERDIESGAAKIPNADTAEAYRQERFRELAPQIREYDEAVAAARMISKWDPYDQNVRASWFNAEYMFGVDDGFDVVIGNPPYVQLQTNGGLLRKRYKSAGYETFASTGDIYQLFFERGCRMLKTGTGALAYITSNSWLKAEYGKSLRQWFAERHTPLRLIEMGKDVFENAIVDAAVLIVRSGQDRTGTCLAVDVDQAPDGRFPPLRRDWGTLEPTANRPWIALSSIERSIMEKMQDVGTPLKEWDISIYRGVLTGYNAAFIIDQATRDSLVAEDPRSAELLRPVLRGRDLARYRANWAGNWLISTFPSRRVDIGLYPGIKRHLLSYGKERLAQEGRRLPGGRRSRKKTGNAWYELQDTCAYHEAFSKEKLFWMDLTPRGRFSYAPAGMETFCVNSVYFMHGPMMKLLAAFLNSSLISWFVNKNAVTSGMGTARWFAVTVEAIPIPQAARDNDAVNSLVDQLLAAMKGGELGRIESLESTIEDLVCHSYGITERERNVIKAPSAI